MATIVNLILIMHKLHEHIIYIKYDSTFNCNILKNYLPRKRNLTLNIPHARVLKMKTLLQIRVSTDDEIRIDECEIDTVQTATG